MTKRCQAGSFLRRFAPLWASLGLAAAVFLLYGRAATHEFVNWDDNLYVYENPRVQNGLTLNGLAWAFTSSHTSNWHPVTWLSHMSDCEVFGLHAGGHHAVSVGLHAANAILLFGALLLMTGRFWPCLLVATLFAVHPLRVESVAWVSERKDVLSGFFWMLSMLAYGWYARVPGLGRYLLVFVAMLLGLTAKPMLVTLPLVLLLLDVWPLGRLTLPWARTNGSASFGRTFPQRVKEKVPLLVLSAVSCAVTVWAQRSGGALISLDHVSLPARLANALVAYVLYLWKTIWPSDLTFFYPHPAIVSPDRSTVLLATGIGAGLLLAGVTAYITMASRRRPYLAAGWYWYLLTLVPVIGLIQVSSQAMADRYAYLPLIGIYIIVAWSAADLTARRPRRRPALAAVFGILIVALMVATWFQVGTWSDSRTLYEHAIRTTPDNFVALHNLGVVHEEQGDLEQAASRYEAAVRAHPGYAEGHYSLGHVRQQAGELEAARESYERALRIRPGYQKARNNLGNVLGRLGRPDEAEAVFERGLEQTAGSAKEYNNLGVLLANQGRLDEAVARYEQALRVDPDYAEAHNNLGLVLSEKGRLAEAALHFQHAVRARPDYADPYNGLGVVLSKQGQSEQARRQFEQGLRLDPDNARIHNNLGIELERQGRLADAAGHFETAVRLDPDYAQAHNNLGIALTGQGRLREAAAEFQRALSIDPEYADPYNGLGILLASQGRLREAVAYFENAVRLNPGYRDAQNNLERARGMLGTGE